MTGKCFYPHSGRRISAPRIAHIRFNDAAQPVVISGQRHLDHAFCSPVDLLQQIDITQNPIGFCLDCGAESVFADYFEAFPGQTELRFAVHIGTFSSIVAGAQKAGQGEFLLDGKPYAPNDMVEAQSRGVSMIIQEMGTIPKITEASKMGWDHEYLQGTG